MADFRLRIGFAELGAALWLSHLEVVRSMERCVRRSGVPYAISQGFSPHMKHTFSGALPVGTGSTGEYMDVELESLVEPEQALRALQAVQHECLPVLSAEYVVKGDPSLQVYFNFATYLIEFDDPADSLVPELVSRLTKRGEIEVKKKGRLKTYDLSDYVVEASCYEEHDDTAAKAVLKDHASTDSALCLSLLSRPEGSLRPEVILEALAHAEPCLDFKITSLMRVALEHQELP